MTRRGARESAPAGTTKCCHAQSFHGRNSRAAMRKTFRIQTTTSPSPTAGNTPLRSLGSVGFQTCHIAYSLKSAGREAAPAVVWKSALQQASGRSYSQFEFVICEFLPAMNLAGQARYH